MPSRPTSSSDGADVSLATPDGGPLTLTDPLDYVRLLVGTFVVDNALLRAERDQLRVRVSALESRRG